MVEKKPKIAETELEKMEKQFDAFDANVKELTHDRMSQAPKVETEPETKIAQSDLEKMKDVYLKPDRVIGTGQKFNEKFRDQLNFDKEYVCFIAENNESKDLIELWTRPYGGMPAEFWKVPVGKPVWGPRYLAEQIKRCCYHRLTMTQNTVGADGMGQYYGAMAVDTTIQRLDARPASTKKSIFMGARSF
jgi:hypothetical protein